MGVEGAVEEWEVTVIISSRQYSGRAKAIECGCTSRVKRQDVQTKRISGVNLGLPRDELKTLL